MNESSTFFIPPADNQLELTVLMPCLNESASLSICIDQALETMRANGIRGEVLIADNGSTDGSQRIAAEHGARVVPIETRGYGSALRGGIAAARGEYILMGDADASYDFSQLPLFLNKLREGFDLVMGNRFKGGILPGAMPPLHRYLGNPVLTAIGKRFFKSPIGDFHCGLRAFRKEAIDQLQLRTLGMEFASEMVVKASIFGLRIAEIPPPSLQTAATVHLTSALGVMVGVICDFFCFIVRAGYSSILVSLYFCSEPPSVCGSSPVPGTLVPLPSICTPCSSPQ